MYVLLALFRADQVLLAATGRDSDEGREGTTFLCKTERVLRSVAGTSYPRNATKETLDLAEESRTL